VSTVAGPARTGTHARRAIARKERAGRRVLAGGVVWIVAVAVLLAGVVAVNVAVLRLNLSLDGANHQRGQLKADIAAIEAKLASAKRTGNIVTGVAGLVPADPAATTVVSLKP
jgi:hypothetical protein